MYENDVEDVFNQANSRVWDNDAKADSGDLPNEADGEDDSSSMSAVLTVTDSVDSMSIDVNLDFCASGSLDHLTHAAAHHRCAVRPPNRRTQSQEARRTVSLSTENSFDSWWSSSNESRNRNISTSSESYSTDLKMDDSDLDFPATSSSDRGDDAARRHGAVWPADSRSQSKETRRAASLTTESSLSEAQPEISCHVSENQLSERKPGVMIDSAGNTTETNTAAMIAISQRPTRQRKLKINHNTETNLTDRKSTPAAQTITNTPKEKSLGVGKRVGLTPGPKPPIAPKPLVYGKTHE